MCGVVGIVSHESVYRDIYSGLVLLEYRGYDSGGILTLEKDSFQIRKHIGKISGAEFAAKEPLSGCLGIGHVRWATHGAPSLENAHPIVAHGLSIVHNGIIENYRELKSDLIKSGYDFKSDTDTDTEVVLHLIDSLHKNNTLLEAILLAVKKLKGAFAIGIASERDADKIFAIRSGSPLLVALAQDKRSSYFASDAMVLGRFCSEVTYLEDGQIAVLSRDSYSILDFEGVEVEIKKESLSDFTCPDLNDFSHFMLKEIYEQPSIVAKLLQRDGFNVNLADFNHITMVGCGTSLCAAWIAKRWIEDAYGIRVSVEIASELNNRNSIIVTDSDLFIFISQSGETADTLTALKRVLKAGARTLGVVNSPKSSLVRLAHDSIFIEAGIEIAVAATKTFLAQLAVFALLAGFKGSAKAILPNLISESIQMHDKIAEIVQHAVVNASKVLFIGVGLGYPLALEGALKLKELSYIPSEGIAAGELKHGSIALVGSGDPIIAIAPRNSCFAKITSSIHEVKARGGTVILISTSKGCEELQELCDYFISVPEVESEFEIPFVYAPILQLIAYNTALLKGLDVDSPRNLAKSVTVE